MKVRIPMAAVFGARRCAAGSVLLVAGLALVAAGCGDSSKPKTPAQQPAAAEAEEKAEEPAQQAAPKAEKAEAKPVAIARRRSADPTKWDLTDMKTALLAHDARFMIAVLV
ncbi:MAG TPA: hypothetical protein VEI07_21210, partial [Planctomycetaceae bacterium]|nr:hypothetical protein [Planctomycetaceae bacterium]